VLEPDVGDLAALDGDGGLGLLDVADASAVVGAVLDFRDVEGAAVEEVELAWVLAAWR